MALYSYFFHIYRPYHILYIDDNKIIVVVVLLVAAGYYYYY